MIDLLPPESECAGEAANLVGCERAAERVFPPPPPRQVSWRIDFHAPDRATVRQPAVRCLIAGEDDEIGKACERPPESRLGVSERSSELLVDGLGRGYDQDAAIEAGIAPRARSPFWIFDE